MSPIQNLMRGQLKQEDALGFMFAGNATVTIVDTSKSEPIRFTYKIKAPKYVQGNKIKVHETSLRFVSLMNGPDNENSFAYFAFIKLQNNSFSYKHGGLKARVGRLTDSVSLFELVMAHLRSKYS